MIHVQQSDAFITPHRIQKEIDPAANSELDEQHDGQKESESQPEASDS